MSAHDRRFDGVFFVGVRTTRIYCRPVCTVRLPRFEHCAFFRYAASAERSGFRPCLRCRPELAPGGSKVDAVRRVAHLAAERIRAGALSEAGIEDLAAELGLSSRQLRRAIEAEYGVSPLALAQTHRLLLAKQLLTDTSLRIVDVAFASGFSSVRRFNAAFRERYRLAPSELRKRAPEPLAQGLVLGLGYRPPLAWDTLIEFLASRGSPRCEQRDGATYRRTLRSGATLGWIAASHDERRHQIRVEVAPELLPHLVAVQGKLRALFDLDAHPEAIREHLARDATLAPLVERRAGLRVPGTVDPFELALRTVIGQQVSVKAASTVFGRLIERFGEPVETPFAALDRVLPEAAQMSQVSEVELRSLGLTRARAATLRALAHAFATGEIDFERMPSDELLPRLLKLPGIGPWTASYIAMRGLGDPDAFPLADLGLLRALDLARPAELEARARDWAPWRAYAALHLWHSGVGGG